MRVVVFSAGAAFGGYLVELDGGDQMTVDSYWQDGDRMHLVRGGVDMSVPRSRVRSVKESSEPVDAPAAPEAAPAPAGSAKPRSGADVSREDLERERLRVDRRAVLTQVRISQALARGDSKQRIRHLEKDFERTSRRQRELKGALGD